MRLRLPLLVGLSTLALASPMLGSAGAAVAAPQPAAPGATEKIIVTLADQLPATPPDRAHPGQRAQAARSSQDAVLARLRGPAPSNLKQFSVGNAFSATVTTDQADALVADPAVASVTLDRDVAVAPAITAPKAATTAATAAAPAPVDPAACSSDPSKPLLEPEALGTMNARSSDPNAKTAAALGIDGSGVKVAFIADGINPANEGFRRADGSSSIVDYKDFYGDGPNAVTSGAEAFGDASAVSAQGNVVYDVAQFSNPNVVSYPGGHCYIKIVGVAPGAEVVALKAGSELLPNSAILQSIDYAVNTSHVDVLNESFGGNIYPDSGARNTIQLFDEQAVKAGVTVTVSTGDAGTTSTIGSPATSPKVISAGASTDSRLYEQSGYALATAFGNGTWKDDNISSLSSAGITQNGRTIDVSAPGEADWAVCDDSGNFTGCTSWQGSYAKIQPFGGTSQSAPMTAGVAALVIQAYRQTHGGTSPSPEVVKQIITSTTRDLGFDGVDQGTGRLDARAAVEAAEQWTGASGASAGLTSQVALSTDQLTLEGAPGTTVTGSVKVTNAGSTPLTVVPSTRKYASLGGSTQTVALDANSAQTTPYPTTGAPWVYKKVTFPVPAGADVLDARLRWVTGAQPLQPGPVVRLSLFAPDGTYVANSRPQGGSLPADYGDMLVRQPAAGTWTAVLYTPQKTGFTGNVTVNTDPQRALPVGSVSGPVVVAPGDSKRISVSLPVQGVGGDTSYTVALGTSSGHQTAVPVVVRAVVPTSAKGTGAFAGTITGGNARAYAPAQSFSYAFDVPQGQQNLDVSVKLAGSAGDTLEGVLVDPNGETPSIVGNTDPKSGKPLTAMQNAVANPLPGRWRYVVVVLNPVTGKTFTQDFTGQVAFNLVKDDGDGVPNGRTIAAGRTVNATVRVTNPGPAPIAVQTDARISGTQRVQLAPQFAGSTFALPLDVENISAVPAFLVPPDTKSVALSAASTVPAQVELQSPGGGIDLFGDLTAGKSGSTVSTATVREKAPAYVGQGFWSTYVQEIGPFGDGGAPAGSTTLVANATTAPFDLGVSSQTGDPYLPSVDPTQSAGTPVIIAPGQSASIDLKITASGASGSQVSGVLNIVTTPTGVANAFNTTGDVIATLPYSYSIK